MMKSVRIALMASLLGTLTAATAGPASALVPQANGSLLQQLRLQDELITEIRARGGGAVRRTTVVGPRGGAAIAPSCGVVPWCDRDMPAAAYAGRGPAGTGGRQAARSLPVRAGFRDRGIGSGVGRSRAGARHVLVLH